MPLSMLHHCIYFLIGVNGIYYSVCTRGLLVLISHAPAGGHPEGGASVSQGVQGIWGTRSPGAPIDNACARLCAHTPSAAPSGDTGLAVPEHVETVPSTPAPRAAGTDPSGRRAPAAGCSCTGSRHVSPGLAGRWQPVQSSCSDWTSRSPSPLAIKIAPGTECGWRDQGSAGVLVRMPSVHPLHSEAVPAVTVKGGSTAWPGCRSEVERVCS